MTWLYCTSTGLMGRPIRLELITCRPCLARHSVGTRGTQSLTIGSPWAPPGHRSTLKGGPGCKRRAGSHTARKQGCWRHTATPSRQHTCAHKKAGYVQALSRKGAGARAAPRCGATVGAENLDPGTRPRSRGPHSRQCLARAFHRTWPCHDCSMPEPPTARRTRSALVIAAPEAPLS